MKITAKLVVLVVVLAATTLLMLPFQLVAIRFLPRRAGYLPMLWQRVARFMIGLKVTVEGRPATSEGVPLLIVANHVSWLDIVTLGSVLPVSFIAKQEVSSWPVVRHLARLQRSVFIDRTRRSATGEAGEAIAARLAKGGALVLFAEGTTGDGISVLPFRSALVGAAAKAAGTDGSITVQPVAIVYTALQGLPIGRLRMADVAWHGDMELAPHLAGLAASGAIDAVVAFGAPIRLSNGDDRKRVTAEAEQAVRTMVRRLRAAAWPRGNAGPFAAARYSHRRRNRLEQHLAIAWPAGSDEEVPPEPRPAGSMAATERTKRVYVKTYGCQMNVYDSERMTDALAADGYQPTDSVDDADLVLLNTCHIREKAAEKVYSELGRIRLVKEAAALEGRRVTVGVTGCVAQAEGAEIARRAPVVDLVVGPQSYQHLPRLLGEVAAATAGDRDGIRHRREVRGAAEGDAGADTGARRHRLPHHPGRLRQVLHLLRRALYARRRGSRARWRRSSTRRGAWPMPACAS